jgi:hypothetical protein
MGDEVDDKRKNEWSEANTLANSLLGGRSPDTALVTVGIMAVEAFERKVSMGRDMTASKLKSDILSRIARGWAVSALESWLIDEVKC